MKLTAWGGLGQEFDVAFFHPLLSWSNARPYSTYFMYLELTFIRQIVSTASGHSSLIMMWNISNNQLMNQHNKRFLFMYPNARTANSKNQKSPIYIFACLYEVVKLPMSKCNAESCDQPMNAFSHLPLATVHRETSKHPFHISSLQKPAPSFVPSPSSLPQPLKYVINHDSGSLSLQSSFARIPRCSAYPRKSVSTFLPSQHIVPPTYLPSASQDRSSTAEPVQAAAECRLLRPLKKLADGCSVFSSP